MKASFIPLLLATLVAASPISLEERATGTTANEFLDNGCNDVIFLYARGSTQDGNMGDQPGPQTSDQLKAAVGSSLVYTQGIPYAATLIGNLASGGVPASDITIGLNLLNKVASTCPSAQIVIAGYSQGAALVHRVLEKATTAVKAQVKAAVTYGDTQKEQDGGVIPNFDPTKTLILCNTGDLVCEGTLTITSAHLDYTGKVPTAVAFMVSKLS